MKSMTKIGFLGSVATDNIITTDHIPDRGERVYGKWMGRSFGGMALNQSLESARYFNDVEIIGKVGGDSEGRRIISYLNSRHVGTNLLIVDKDLVTGQASIFLVEDDYFSIVTEGANKELTPGEAENAVGILHSGTLVASLEINVDAVFAAILKAHRVSISTVLIPSPAENCHDELLESADSLILNRREARMLLGFDAETVEDVKAELSEFHTHYKYLVITMGNQGAILQEGNRIYSVPALEVEAIDVTGAGDAFSGAFVVAIAQGMPPQKALAFGCIAGGLAASVIGAQTSNHDLASITELYQKYYSR